MSQYEDIAGPIVPRRIARQHPAYGLGGAMLLVIAGLVAMLVAFFVDTVMSWDLLRPDLPRETRLMLHGEVALAILAYVTGYCALARSALFPWLFSGLTAATLLLAGYSIAVVEMGLSARSPGLFQVTACLLGILLPYVVLSRRVAVTYRRDVGDWRPPGMAPAVEPANEIMPAVVEPAAPMESATAAVASGLRPEPVAEPQPAPEPRINPEPKVSAEPKPAVRPAAQDIDFDIPPLAQPIIRRDKARDPFEALLKKQDDPAKPATEKPAATPAGEPNEPPPVAPSFDPVFDDATPAGRVEPPVRPAAAPAGGRYDPFGDDLFAAAAAVSPASDPFFADPAPAPSAPGGGSVPPPTFAATTPPPVAPPPNTPPPAAAPAVAAAPPIPPPKPRAKPASNFDWLSAPSGPPASAGPVAAPVPPPVSPPPAAPAAPSGPFGAPSYGVPPARPAPPPPPSTAEAAPVGDVAPRLYEQLSRLRRIAGTTGQ